ncbi:MAG: glycosyltransferase family 39 protein [Desulfobacterales bacterium]|nr:MAG: glycosyltransferase family 39 protein [Desulfobacterales bacterium]
MISRISSKKILLLFSLTLYFLLSGYKLLRLGIHGDGTEYASVARNLADGVGTFWKPYLDDMIHPVFHEHPPLVFWIQSIFFKIFGNGPYLEAFYGFFIGLIILFLTALLWQQIRRDFQFHSVGSWWPMLLLVPIPIFTYILQINRIVNTWAVIAVVSTYLAYLSTVKTGKTSFYSILTGVFIYLGFIAKGPVAFFPFAVPVLAGLTLKAKYSKAVTVVLISLVTFTVILLATFHFFPDSVKFWQGFWQAQVIASLKSERSAARPHWHYLERWLAEMIVPFLVAGVFMIAAKVPLRRIRFNRQALFFLLVALAGSLPFVVSTRQHGRYIFHTYPFFVLSLAFATENIAAQIESILTNKRKIRFAAGLITVVFFVIAVTSMFYRKNHIARRQPFFHDFYLQNIQLPERITVSACPGDMILGDWLFADMQRFYRVSLTPKMGNEFLIIAKNANCTVPEGYQKVHQQPTIKYVLYKRIQP